MFGFSSQRGRTGWKRSLCVRIRPTKLLGIVEVAISPVHD